MDSDNNILYFCEIANLAGIKKYIDEGKSPNFQNEEGESPLQVAAANGFLNIVNLLIKNGAFIDLPNNYGWTPLMLAARYGHISTVAFLLKLKAKVNVCNNLGLTPVVAAVWSGCLPILKLMVEAGALINFMSSDNPSNECDLTSLMAASLQGHEDILKFLLEKGADIHQTSSVTGLSPLMLAACEGHKKLVRIIVELGGIANDINICGKTALDYAIECGKDEVTDYLRSVAVSKYKPEFPPCIENLPTVKIDSPDSNMFENSPSMCTSSHDFSPRKEFFLSSAASDTGKLSSSGRLHSKRSHPETKVKEWIGGVAQHLQHKMFTHGSPRHSSKSPNLEVQSEEESLNDVFELQDSPFDEYDNEELNPSFCLAPNQYLADILKEHNVEAIKPPFPSCSFSKIMKNLRAKKTVIDSYPKPYKNSLQLPRLLKNYSKKKFEFSKEDSFRKSTSSKGGSFDENETLEIPTSETESFPLSFIESLELNSEEEKEDKLECSALAQNFEAENVPSTSKAGSISDNDLSILLSKESLQKYAEKFRDQEVDIKTFQQLTKDDLADIGIQSTESQKKLFELIKKLQNEDQPCM